MPENKPIIIVEVSGGVVQSVYANDLPAECVVRVLDHDNDEDEEDDETQELTDMISNKVVEEIPFY